MTECLQVDCEAGRALGCQTFCCRLLVRKDPVSPENEVNDNASGRFIEKGADGFCICLDRKTYLCKIWAERSSVCRGYDCNYDLLLQAALRHKFGNIVELARISSSAYIPKDTYKQVPYKKTSDS
jgi:uncharacterized protein